MGIAGINVLVAVAMFALVLGLAYLLSLFFVRIGLLPPLPSGGTPRARRHGRAKQIAGIQAIYGVLAALAAFLITGVVFSLIIYTPVGIPYMILVAFPLEYAVEVWGLPRAFAGALFFAIPPLPIHAAAQFCAYGFAVRQVKWLAA